MNLHPSLHLKRARLSFFIFIIPCIFLAPQIFRQDLGISNYGVNPVTIIPYSLGFLSSITFLILASNSLIKKSGRLRIQAAWLLRAAAFLQLTLLVIPDSKNSLIRYTHVGVGMTLFVSEFVIALWLILRTNLSSWNNLVITVQAIAGISAFFSLGHSLSLEAPSQLLFQLAFMTVCIEAVKQLEK